MTYAPIAIFCYRRLDVLKLTVDNLLLNKESKYSDCYVFSDGFKNDQDKADVIKVREYIHTIKGFSNIYIVESIQNKGLASSIIDGVTRVVNEYGKVIVIEDDILTSPFFLQYMNDALEIYKDDEIVGCISGYVYPVDSTKNTFFIRGSDCWGWATWDRAWKLFNPDGASLLNELLKKDLMFDFNFDDSYPYDKMLENQIVGKNNSWAIRWYASLYLKNMLCLYPGKTLVKNIGFGVGGSTHCTDFTNVFDSEFSKKPIDIIKLPFIEDSLDRKLFSVFFKKSMNEPRFFNRLKKTRFWLYIKPFIKPPYNIIKRALLPIIFFMRRK